MLVIVVVLSLRRLGRDAKRLHAPPRGQLLDVCVLFDRVPDVILDAIEKSSDLSTSIAPKPQHDDKLLVSVVKHHVLGPVFDV